MKILGIIAEFNPFHNGHKYLIENAKEKTNADLCVVVMSGNFVQRGEVAIMDKYSRAKICSLYGADLVIELPVYISTASAEGFAFGAVSLLNSLGCIDFLAFGTEYTNITLLEEIADVLITESDEFKSIIKNSCINGDSYPTARSKAVISCFPEELRKEVDFILNSPNCILAIEYLKALKKLKSNIRPVPIRRIGANYNEISSEKYASATGIRDLIKNNGDLSVSLPKEALTETINYKNYRGFIFEEDIFSILMYKLLILSADELEEFSDCNVFLANKMKNSIYEISNYKELIQKLTSKDYTISRIKRVLIHILLDIKKNNCTYTPHYAHILSCVNEKALSIISKNAHIPIITKLSKQLALLDLDNKERLLHDINATNIYQGILSDKYNINALNEFQQNIFPTKIKG